ncbi:hypothetical protein OF364_02980, partial [Mycoplasma enhydrae]|uniref:hypothetical protein n=1 Tax=Mycoplasma enhydrae TaxID=2499220 RepID=UPI002987FEAE
NIDELKKAIVALEAQKTTSQGKYDEHNIPINQAVGELQTALDDLKNELNGIDAFIANLKQTQETNEKAVKDKLNEALKKAEDAIKKADEAGTDKSKLDEAKEDLEKAKEALEEAKQKAEEKGDADSAKQAEDKAKEVTEKLTEINNKLDDTIAKEIDGATATLKNAINNLNSKDGVDELNTQLPKFEAEITKAKAVYDKYNKDEYKNKVSVPEKLEALKNTLDQANTLKTTKTNERDTKKQATEDKYNEAETAKNEAFEDFKNAGEDSTKLAAALEKLRAAKQKAADAKTLAITNKYKEYETKAEDLEKEIDDK